MFSNADQVAFWFFIGIGKLVATAFSFACFSMVDSDNDSNGKLFRIAFFILVVCSIWVRL